jgi:hypothetical protein
VLTDAQGALRSKKKLLVEGYLYRYQAQEYNRTDQLYEIKERKSSVKADNLVNLSPYNSVVRETTTDFKLTNIQTKIVQV